MQTGYLVTADGVTLTRFKVPAVVKARGTVFVTHSIAQHTCNLSASMAGLAARGWTAYGTDLRGHGHSAGRTAPLGHMEIGKGWERLVADLALALREAFQTVPWEERLVVAPNIGALLVLEVLKDWPDLSQNIVFVTPPTNQPALMKLGRGFARARSFLHAPDKPDEMTHHQLYSFLGAHLEGRDRLIDVVSSDRAVTDALIADPLAWFIPTTGYFHEMFRGIESAWRWQAEKTVKQDTRMLILYGGDDPMTANGRFVGPMRAHLERIGFAAVDAHCVREGRAGLIIEEERFGLSRLIDDWSAGRAIGAASGAVNAEVDMREVSTGVLQRYGLNEPDRELSADELVEMCYHAIEDEDRWTEVLYRMAFALSTDSNLSDKHLEALFLALMPHLDRSYRLSRQVLQSAALGAILENVIDRLGIGTAVVASDFAISYANEAFTQTLARLLAQPALAGSCDLADLSRRLQAMVREENRQELVLGQGEGFLYLGTEVIGFHFRPRALAQSALKRGGPTGVVILRDIDRPTDTNAALQLELLQFAYGLTAKEAEAAAGVVSGKSPEVVAEELGITINTMRTHLRRVFEKTGVHGQTELAARLLRGPMGLIA
ncbi:alpha/beta hydrolase [Fulvimarina sp. MAC8]|uniref:serine aminopeptidase domain-containing protein n=1 Tax=Fulvimarina sp. MAC8 TaxID=3162874 RepID=UPI0032ED7A7B